MPNTITRESTLRAVTDRKQTGTGAANIAARPIADQRCDAASGPTLLVSLTGPAGTSIFRLLPPTSQSYPEDPSQYIGLSALRSRREPL
jgi:hypothetical protein